MRNSFFGLLDVLWTVECDGVGVDPICRLPSTTTYEEMGRTSMSSYEKGADVSVRGEHKIE